MVKKVTAPATTEKTEGKVDDLNGTYIWSYLIERHGLTNDQLVHMKQAVCPAIIEGKPITLCRIFKPADAKEKAVTVMNYQSLNDHPGLILYEGYYFKGGLRSDIFIEKKEGVMPTSLEKRIKEGAINEIGVPEVKTTGQRWLGRIGSFMMYGGWMLILALILIIIILVNILSHR